MPSDRLRRIATAASAPQFRECSSCQHRHPAGERCGYPIGYFVIAAAREVYATWADSTLAELHRATLALEDAIARWDRIQ